MRFRPVRLILILCWLLLLALLVRRDILLPGMDGTATAMVRETQEPSWYGIWFQDTRIGYASEQLTGGGDMLQLHQQAHLLLDVLGRQQAIDMDLRARIASTSLLRDFEFSLQSPLARIQASGTVEGNRIHYRTLMDNTEKKGSLLLTGPPLLPVNQRGYLLQRLPEKGSKIRIPQFDPLALLGRESVISYQGKEKLLVGERIQLLHRFISEAGAIRSEFWLDEQGRVIREQSPAGFVFLAEPEFKARDIRATGRLQPGQLPPDLIPQPQ